MMEILFGNFEKDFLFFRNWISVHLQNHLSSIYMRFYQLKQPELVLLDKNWIESLWSTSFSSSHKKNTKKICTIFKTCCIVGQLPVLLFFYLPCLIHIIFLFSDTCISFLSMQNQNIIFLFIVFFWSTPKNAWINNNPHPFTFLLFSFWCIIINIIII
jgi:hypothetical protein